MSTPCPKCDYAFGGPHDCNRILRIRAANTAPAQRDPSSRERPRSFNPPAPDVANANTNMANVANNGLANTYRYRDADKRREYMRQLMADKRARARLAIITPST